jgi:NAD(P)H-flavin reductase/hemoglobin-like flavoprotein
VSDVPHVLQESWALVEERQDDLARYVFARLFLTHPEARALFPVAMDTPRIQLLTALAHTVRLAGDAPARDFYLRALGREHRKYQLTERHLRTLALALLDGVRSFGGEGWTSRYDEAWAEAVRQAGTTIRAGAAAEHGTPATRDAEVRSHLRIGADLAVLTVAPVGPLTFHAGQHLPVETPFQPRVWREFAVANAPRRDGTLDLHIRAEGGGLVSGALVRRVRVGDRIRLGAPSGGMTLDRRSTRDIVCVAAGTGLAPIKALIEELTRFNRTRWVHLFFAGRDRDDLYDLAALRRLAARHPWLSVVPVVADDPGFGSEHGTAAEVVARYGPWPDHDCFVAGPAGEVHGTVRALRGLGVPDERIRSTPFESSGEPDLELPPLLPGQRAGEPVEDLVGVGESV